MITLLIYMFSLIIIALLIGFAIGWIIRRRATRVNYEENINELTARDKDSISELNLNAMELEDSNMRFLNTEDKLSSQKELILNYTKNETELKTELKDLDISNKQLLNDIQNIGKKIELSSNDLRILTSQKDEILKYKKQLADDEENINQKTKATQDLSESITRLIEDRESLNKQIANQNEAIVEIEQKIIFENENTKTITDEFATKKSEIIDDVEECKLKALNYQYALKYIQEKLDSSEKIEFDVVDKIISKNEEKGLFANLKQKLFSKSAIYIRGGK